MTRFRISGLVKYGSATFNSEVRRWPASTSRQHRRSSGSRGSSMDRHRAQAGGHPTSSSSARSRRSSPRRRRSAPARSRQSGRRGHQQLHQLPARLPPGLRRHRSLRRQLRDRKLALDHDRPAHARVRHPAHAWRDAPPGSPFDLRRGSCDRDARLDRGPLLRACSRRACSACSTRSGSRCRTAASRRGPDSDRRADRRHRRHAGGEPRPAIRATRVPPIAAVSEGATLPPSRFARFRTVGSTIVTVLGFAALLYGLFGSGLGTTGVLGWMGFGALLIFIGVSILSVRFV